MWFVCCKRQITLQALIFLQSKRSACIIYYSRSGSNCLSRNLQEMMAIKKKWIKMIFQRVNSVFKKSRVFLIFIHKLLAFQFGKLRVTVFFEVKTEGDLNSKYQSG
jgi:hypothetical protein